MWKFTLSCTNSRSGWIIESDSVASGAAIEFLGLETW